MKIIKIKENKEDKEYSEVFCEHNGMTFKYNLLSSLQPSFMKELGDFKRFFFDCEHESWQGVMSINEALEFFKGLHFIRFWDEDNKYDTCNRCESIKLKSEINNELCEFCHEAYQNEVQ